MATESHIHFAFRGIIHPTFVLGRALFGFVEISVSVTSGSLRCRRRAIEQTARMAQSRCDLIAIGANQSGAPGRFDRFGAARDRGLIGDAVVLALETD